MHSIELSSFNISHTGFLPQEPLLSRLPDHYEQWETIIDVLPQLLKEWKLRDKIKELPLLPVSDSWLPTERHWQRAYCVLTFLSQGYLWERGEGGTVSTLPQQLAIPWCETASRCGLPPVITYASAVLWNWSLKDPDEPISFNNLHTIFSFTGDRSEEWFYLVHQGIELEAAVGVKAAVDCLRAVAHQDNNRIIQYLNNVTESIQNMVSFFSKMYNECKPDFFYNKMRPFQAGSKNLVAFSGGVIFEGVDTEPKKFIGVSAAQSSTIPVFDILLGVKHHGTDEEFLDLQRWHMQRSHRQFLLALSLQPSLREYIHHHRSNEVLVTAYNSCIKELVHFRSEHIKLITRYIVIPAQRQKKKNQVGLSTTEDMKGASATQGLSTTEDMKGASATQGLSTTEDMKGASATQGLSTTEDMKGASATQGLSTTEDMKGASATQGLSTTEDMKGASATHGKSEEKKGEGTLAERGTGGTPFMKFLKAVRDDTLRYEIK